MKKIILITMLMSAVFAQSDCNESNWQEYYNSEGRDMTDCDFSGVNLEGADLTGADLRGADFTYATDIVTAASINYTGTARSEEGLNLGDESNIINGNGLAGGLGGLLPDGSNIGTLTHDAVTFTAPGNAWATIDAGGGDWFTVGENDGTVIFDFDLGGSFEIDSIAVWGYHFGAANGNSISDITLDFSTDGGGTTNSSQMVGVPFPGTFNLATIVGLTPTHANFVTMTVNDNHFGGPGGGDRVGIAEIHFTGANLSPANLKKANLSEADLRGANLTGVNLSMADLSRANLEGVISSMIRGVPDNLPEGWSLVDGTLIK